MSDQVEEVKQKTDIVSVIGEFVTLKKAGSNFKALCPFHSEKTPSFMVSAELQIFKCFGCGESGDVISFLQKYEGMEFYEALKYLADKVGIKLKPLGRGDGGIKEKLYEINSLATRFYQYILLNHPVGKLALEYLMSTRGLKRQTVETFRLGYSPNHPLALKKYLIERKRISSGELKEAGIVYEKEGRSFDRFRGRVIFPLFDHRENVVGFAGRVLPQDENKDIAKYINTPETPIYHKSKVLYGLNLVKNEIKKEKKAVIVEGELDMISSWQAGIKNSVAIKGSALTEEQTKLLSRFTKSLVFALDADFAGDAAVRRGVSVAEKEGLDIKVARLTNFKDPDEAARKNPKELKEAIADAKGVWDFIIDSVFAKFGSKSGEQKAKLSHELIPILSSIADKIVQAHYINLVARKLNVPTEAVFEEVSGIKRKKEDQRPKLESFVRTPTKSRREILEERLLGVVFRLNPMLLKRTEVSDLLTMPFSKRILEEFQNFESKKKRFDPSLFAENLPKELFEGFVDLTLKEIKGLEEGGEERFERELGLIAKELKILAVKNHLENLSDKIRKLEASNEKEALKTKEEEFGKLTKELSELEARDFKGIILKMP